MHKITHRITIEDNVFFMYRNEVHEGKVMHFKTNVSNSGVTITHTVVNKVGTHEINENNLFLTKKELLESL